jgi:hypothetical protein
MRKILDTTNLKNGAQQKHHHAPCATARSMHAPQPDNLDYRRKQQAAAHSSQNARIMKSERDNKRIDLI